MNKKGQQTQKKFVLSTLIIVTIIFIIMIIAMWAGLGYSIVNGKQVETTLTSKLMITFGGLIVLLIGYLLFKHQENLDKRKQ